MKTREIEKDPKREGERDKELYLKTHRGKEVKTQRKLEINSREKYR